MKPRTIVVATDLSAAATPVYHWAAELAKRFNSRVTLLNVDETGELEWFARGLESSVRLRQLRADLALQREQMLEHAVHWFKKQQIPTAIRAISGRASDCIIEHTKLNRVDLLVLGKRGTRESEWCLLGSTVKRVLRRTDVPALVVPRARPGCEPHVPFSGKRIIVPTAFSPPCLMTLDRVLALNETLAMHVEHVHVVRLPMPFTIRPEEWAEIVAGDTRQRVKAEYEKQLDAAIGEQRRRSCSVEAIFGVGIAEALQEYATKKSADLVALPSCRHRSDFPIRFGSTTEGIIRRSLVPALVFPLRYLEKDLPAPGPLPDELVSSVQH